MQCYTYINLLAHSTYIIISSGACEYTHITYVLQVLYIYARDELIKEEKKIETI